MCQEGKIQQILLPVVAEGVIRRDDGDDKHDDGGNKQSVWAIHLNFPDAAHISLVYISKSMTTRGERLSLRRNNRL